MTLATTFNERLEKAEIDINRKMLSEIAISDDKAFAELVSKAKEALNNIYTRPGTIIFVSGLLCLLLIYYLKAFKN